MGEIQDVEEEEEEMVGVTVETEVMEVTEMDAEMVAEMGAKKTDEQRQQQQMLNVAIKLFRTKLHKEKSQAMLAKTIPLIVWLHGASALDTKTLSLHRKI